tara:strand:+ start:535 stop:1053 length:519 start_codon:yes stop_codon:yes gene_type:complete
MNTTNPSEDLFADFFQVSGGNTQYSNFASLSASVASKNSKGISSKGGLSKLAKVGRKNNFIGKAFQKYTEIYDKVVYDFGASEQEIDNFWNEWVKEGNSTKDISTFYGFIESKKGDVLKEQIINEQNTLGTSDLVDVSDVDFTKKDKKGISLLYVGLGAIALVGATILIVKK